MEIDWGDKCHGHETYHTGNNTSEVDWGGHDHNSNHMNESLLSEVDFRAHDSSVFLFLVNIDYDAKPNESSIIGYEENYNIEHPPFLSLGLKLILWLLDKLEMIVSTPHDLT